MRCGEDLLCYENEGALAMDLPRVIAQPERLEEMARKARVACAGKFSWPSRGQALLSALEGRT